MRDFLSLSFGAIIISRNDDGLASHKIILSSVFLALTRSYVWLLAGDKSGSLDETGGRSSLG